LAYTEDELYSPDVMGRSKLLTVVIATTLMFSNMACACAPGDMSAEPATAHHHVTSQSDVENTPCSHQDCEGCGDLLESCTTADDSLTTVDRDARLLPPQKPDPDVPDSGGLDLDIAFLDTGPVWRALPEHISWTSPLTTVSRVADTPVQRKDQLTE
jgi:hypothetical protein